MTYERFLQSLFLVFTEGASIAEGRFPEVTVAMAKSLVETQEGTMYARMKRTCRFHTVANEPVEIRMESKQRGPRKLIDSAPVESLVRINSFLLATCLQKQNGIHC